jgi:hypothetical protein
MACVTSSRVLSQLVAYLDDAGASTLTVDLAIAWVQQLPRGVRAISMADRLGMAGSPATCGHSTQRPRCHLAGSGRPTPAGRFPTCTPRTTCVVCSKRHRALLHNLTEDDYGRPLDELRNSFWSSPRLPLLPGGEDDLRSAIFEAIVTDQIVVVDDQGDRREVLAAGEIALNQPSLRLQRVRPEPEPKPTDDETPAGEEPGPVPPAPGTEETDVMVAFTVRTSLRDQQRAFAVGKVLGTLATDVDSDIGVSHIDMTVRVTLPRAKAQTLAAQAENAGASPVLTEL